MKGGSVHRSCFGQCPHLSAQYNYVNYIASFALSDVQGDTRESDGFQKKKYSVDFQIEMDLFVQK